MSSTPLVYPIRDLAIGKVGSTHPLERFPFAANGTSGHILTFPEEVGNLYSRPQTLSVPVENNPVIRLEFTERVPDENLPTDTDLLRFVRIRSALLTAFHGRPIDLRAGIILPRGFEDERDRRYPITNAFRE